MKKLFIFGAGGHAKTVIDAVESQGTYQIAGILDDDPSKHETMFYGYRVLGGREVLADKRSSGVSFAFPAVGGNRVRQALSGLIEEHGYAIPVLVHPGAYLLRDCLLGKGTVVLAGAVVGADVVVGEGTIINIHSVLGHDSRVGDFGQIAPHATLNGFASVGNCTLIGSGAVVLSGITIAEHVIVGANSLVNRDLPPGVTAVGSPAEIIKRIDHES